MVALKAIPNGEAAYAAYAAKAANMEDNN